MLRTTVLRIFSPTLWSFLSLQVCLTTLFLTACLWTRLILYRWKWSWCPSQRHPGDCWCPKHGSASFLWFCPPLQVPFLRPPHLRRLVGRCQSRSILCYCGWCFDLWCCAHHPDHRCYSCCPATGNSKRRTPFYYWPIDLGCWCWYLQAQHCSYRS